ncbi:MAG: glycerophosphodiester phosphodiesterase [Candidatus Latescibacteria bacterium]|nr:glycerophosphodiester phosphodiesterase [Candidatus Latescibacterota bacterium]
MTRPYVVIAHRGASGRELAPENTLSAFEKAIDLGVDLIELDVHATRDDEVVVIHDATLERTTHGKGPVRERTLAEIKRLDAGSWFDIRYAGEKIPTLKEVLDTGRRRAVMLVEVKTPDIVDSVIRDVREMRVVDDVVIQSFYRAVIKKVREMNPRLPTALIVGGATVTNPRRKGRSLVKRALKAGANTLSIWHQGVTPEMVEEVQKRGISLWAWTVNEEADIRCIISAGVNGIISDYPDRLLSGCAPTSEGKVKRWRRWRLGKRSWRKQLRNRKVEVQ